MSGLSESIQPGMVNMIKVGIIVTCPGSIMVASTIPNCVTYDPTYSYELAVIIQDGIRRMYHEKENKFYYITTMNEAYQHPDMPAGAEEGIIKGMYLLEEANPSSKLSVQLMGSGTILNEVREAAKLLRENFNVDANIWSATSMNELRRDALDCSRWNLLHPESEPRVPYVTECLNKFNGPVIASTDYMKLYSDQLREFVPHRFKVLGTDGFGRSDTRKKLRHFFEVDRYFVAIAALKALAEEGSIDVSEVSRAIKLFGINPDKLNPVTV